MFRFSGPVCWTAVVVLAGASPTFAQAKYPIMEEVAQHVSEKYQRSSCAELAGKRGQPPTPAEAKVEQLMRDDAAMRTAFIDRVAGPIANKLFECHLIP